MFEKKRITRGLSKIVLSVVLMAQTFGFGNFALFSIPTAQAAIPRTFGYQGRLKNSSGTAQTGTFSFTFRLYSTSTGGAALWTETQPSVTVDQSFFAVQLGSVTSLPESLDFSRPLFLSTEVNGDGEMTPRIAVNSVMYSIVSGGVDTYAAAPTGAPGRMYFDTTTGELRYFDSLSSAWKTVESTASSTLQTITDNGSSTTNAISFAGGTSTANFSILGNVSASSFTSNSVTLSGGSIDGIVIGAISPQTANFTDLQVNNATSINFYSDALHWLNASGTSVTSTNLFASNGSFNAVTTTNLHVNGVFQIDDLVFTNATGSNLSTFGTVSSTFIHAQESTIGVATASILNVDTVLHVGVGDFPVIGNSVAQFGGTTNTYLQVNIQNHSDGDSASSDYIATNDIGDDSSYYVDLGINSSAYANPDYTITGPNDGYLFANSADLAIGTATSASAIKFHAGGTLASDEVMRLTSDHYVGIGTTNPSSTLDVIGDGRFTGSLTADTATLNTILWTDATGTNLNATGAVRLSANTQINNTSVCLLDGTNCPSGTTPSFQTVTNTGNTTTNAIQFNGGTSTGSFVIQNSLSVSGTLVTVGSASFGNISSTNQSLSGNLDVAGQTRLQNVSSTSQSLSGTLAVSGATELSDLVFVNATGSNLQLLNLLIAPQATITNLSGTNATFTNLAITGSSPSSFANLSWVNATGTNTTSTNLAVLGHVSTNLLPSLDAALALGSSALRWNAEFASVTTTNLVATSLNASNLTWTNATGTNVVITNFQATNATATTIFATNGTVTNLISTTGTLANLLATSATVSGLNVQNGNIANSTSTNAFATNGSATNFTATNATATNLAVTNLTVAGSAPSSFTNLTWTNATGTNTTSTNLFATNGSFTNGTIANGTVTNLLLTNATTSNSTSTNAFATNLSATYGAISNLSFINGTSTSWFGFATASGTTVNALSAFIASLNAPNLSSSNVAISGGTINGVTIGATSPSTAVFTNATTTNLITTGLSAATANVTNLTATNATLTNIVLTGSVPSSFQNLTWVNATGTNTTSTNLFVTNGTFVNNTVTNQAVSNLSFTNGTSSVWFGFATASGTTVNANNGSIASLIAPDFTSANATISGGSINGTAIGAITPSTGAFTDLTSDYATSSFFFATRATVGDLIVQNPFSLTHLTWTNATGTNTTSTNLFATNARATNLTGTTILGTSVTATTLAFTNGTSSGWLGFNAASGTNINSQNVTTTRLGVNGFVNTNLNPSLDSTLSLGSAGLRWNGNFGTATVTTLIASSVSSTSGLFTSLTGNSGSFAGLSFTNGTSSGNFVFNLASGTDLTAQTITVSDELVTNSTSTNAFATNGSATNFTATNATATNLAVTNLTVAGSAPSSFTNLTWTNATGTNTTSTNLFATNGSFTNGTITNGTLTNLTFANGTSTAWLGFSTASGTTLNALSASIASLNAGSFASPNVSLTGGTLDGIQIGALVPSTAVFTNTTSTNATSTNLFATNAIFANLTVQSPFNLTNLIWENATGTNTTSTNLYATNALFNGVTTTNLHATGFTHIEDLDFTNATGANLSTFGTVSSTFIHAQESTIGVATASILNVDTVLHVGVGDFPVIGNSVAQFGGTTNTYLQVNIQNHSDGDGASSDYIATNDIGDDSSYYIDFGINSSGYNNPDFSIQGPNDGYLYANSANLTIGTASSSSVIKFHAGGTMASDEVMRITYDHYVGIGTENPSSTLDVIGDGRFTGSLTADTATLNTILWTDATGTNLNATGAVRLSANTQINNTSVCLLDGTNCPSGTTPNLQTVTNTGNTTTNSIVVFGGITTSNLTATGTASLQETTFTSATASIFAVTGNVSTDLKPTLDSALSLGSSSLRWNAQFGSVTATAVTTTNLFANVGTFNALNISGEFSVANNSWTNATGTYTTGTALAILGTARLPSNTQINNTNVCLADGTNCPSGTTPNFQTVTNAGNTTTHAIQFNGGTSTGAFLVQNNLSVTGTVSSTGGFTTVGLTSAGSLSVSGQSNVGNVSSTNISISNKLNVSGETALQALTLTDATATSVTTTNLFATNGNFTNSTITNGALTNLSFTNGTSTSWFGFELASGTTMNAITGFIATLSTANLSSSNASLSGGTINGMAIGSLSPSTAVFTNVTTTNVTSTALFATNGSLTNLTATNATFTNLVLTGGTPSSFVNLVWTNATGTNTTSTNLFATNSRATSLTVTGGTSLQVVTLTNATATNVTTTNLAVSGNVSTNLLPSLDASLALGSSALRWNGNFGSVTTTNLIATTVSSTSGIFTNLVTASGTLTALNFASGTSTSSFAFASASGTTLNAASAFVASLTAPVVSSSNATINGGTINGTRIGNTNPSTGVFTNVTTTNVTSTALFAATANVTNLTATNATLTNIVLTGNAPSSFQNLTWTNATGTNTTSTNLFVTNGTFVSNVVTDEAVSNLSFTNGTSTSWFGFAMASGTTLYANTGSIASLTTSDLTAANVAISGGTINGTAIGTISPSTGAFTNLISDFATSSVLYATRATFGELTLQSPLQVTGLTWTSATGTNTTSTNLFATTARITNLTATTLLGTSVTATTLAFSHGTSTNWFGFASVSGTSAIAQNVTTTNLGVNGSIYTNLNPGLDSVLSLGSAGLRWNGNFGTVTATAAIVSSGTVTNLNSQNAVLTNATATNLAVTSLSVSGSAPSSFSNLVWTNATGTNSTSTYLAVSGGVTTNLNPNADAVLTLGSSALRWNGNFGTVTTTNVFGNSVSSTSGLFTNLNGTNATLSNLTFANGTSTSWLGFATASGTIINALSGSIASLTAPTLNSSNVSFTGGSMNSVTIGNTNPTTGVFTNVTSTSATSTNLFATNAIIANLTVQNPFTLTNSLWTNATGTNTTSTNLFATFARFTTSSSTNETVTFLTATQATSSLLAFTSASGSSLLLGQGVTTTNLGVSGGVSSNLNPTLDSILSLGSSALRWNGNFGTVTTTNLIATSVSSTSGLFTSLTSTNGTLTGLSFVSGTSTSWFGFALASGTTLIAQNVAASGAVFTNATATNATSTNFAATRASITNLTGTNATYTNFEVENLTITGTAPSFNGLVWTNATGTNLVTTNATATNLSLSGTGTFYGAGLTSDCSGTSNKLVWNATTRQFGCSTETGGKTVSVTSTATVSLNGTLQSILHATTTPSNVASQQWVVATVEITNTGNTQRDITMRIMRGSSLSCTAGVQVGPDSVQNINRVNTDKIGLVASFVDAPATTTAVGYNVCVSSSVGSPNVAMHTITVTEVSSGADLAEVYYADEVLAPGEVVDLSATRAGYVERSKQAYDRNVLGIISTRPGYVLSEAYSTGTPVVIALAGRVPVKFSAENGSIEPGDYLTASNRPGFAMKATEAGPTIGRALEGFDPVTVGTSTGLIMTFVQNGYYIPYTSSTGATQTTDVANVAPQTATLQTTGQTTEINTGSTNLTQGNIQVQTLAVKDAAFTGKVEVKGHLALGQDAAGQAKILSGQTEVKVLFTEKYDSQPIVTATPLDFIDTMYRVTDITDSGFTIQLNSKQSSDKLFNWHSFASNEAKIFVSDGTTQDVKLEVSNSVETTPVTSPAQQTTEVSSEVSTSTAGSTLATETDSATEESFTTTTQQEVTVTTPEPVSAQESPVEAAPTETTSNESTTEVPQEAASPEPAPIETPATTNSPLEPQTQTE